MLTQRYPRTAEKVTNYACGVVLIEKPLQGTCNDSGHTQT